MNRINSMIVMAGQRAAAWAVATEQRLERRATPTRQTRQLFNAAYALTFALMAIAPMAHAQQSFADSFNTAGETIDAGKALAGKAGILFAIILVISAGLLMKKRSTEGQSSQVKTGAIIGCIIAAVVCGGAGAILYRAGASVGLQTSDYGSLPN